MRILLVSQAPLDNIWIGNHTQVQYLILLMAKFADINVFVVFLGMIRSVDCHITELSALDGYHKHICSQTLLNISPVMRCEMLLTQ